MLHQQNNLRENNLRWSVIETRDFPERNHVLFAEKSSCLLQENLISRIHDDLVFLSLKGSKMERLEQRDLEMMMRMIISLMSNSRVNTGSSRYDSNCSTVVTQTRGFSFCICLCSSPENLLWPLTFHYTIPPSLMRIVKSPSKREESLEQNLRRNSNSLRMLETLEPLSLSFLEGSTSREWDSLDFKHEMLLWCCLNSLRWSREGMS